MVASGIGAALQMATRKGFFETGEEDARGSSMTIIEGMRDRSAKTITAVRVQKKKTCP